MKRLVTGRITRALIGVVAACICLWVSDAAAGAKFVSWADLAHRYGWTDVTSGGQIVEGARADRRCSGTQRSSGTSAFLCSTEDGGRSWQRIFQAGTGLNYLRDFTRTSKVAGVVSISREDPLPHTLRTGVFWTRDNGAHWYETTRIGSLVEHGADRLLWRNPGGPLYEVRPWPPRKAVRCPGFFTWHALDQHERRAGTICVGGTVNAGMRSVRVPERG